MVPNVLHLLFCSFAITQGKLELRTCPTQLDEDAQTEACPQRPLLRKQLALYHAHASHYLAQPDSLSKAHMNIFLVSVVVTGFTNTRSETPLFFSWFVCVLALSPVRMLAVTSARMLAVPPVRIAGWPPRHHLSSRRLPPKVYRASSTSLSENVRVATGMRKSQNLFERRSETRVLSSVGRFLWTRADALSSFDNLKLLVTVTRGA